MLAKGELKQSAIYLRKAGLSYSEISFFIFIHESHRDSLESVRSAKLLG